MQFAEILGSKGLLNFVVDFAHTPDALEKSLKALRGVVGGANKLWVVFGCGGDRDASKRPLMGEIALREADRVIVTSDNPRSEDPQKIIDEVLSSTQKGDISYEKIVDRAEAIRFAFKHMQEGDLCLVAGRGHEEFQLVGSKKIPFRDFDFIRGLAER
jgi:UDP-N-acetylmuramoyl-L-alanyl-D-glutamate--2,6-diaminopimelate ligase